jgi:hypothetical protein
VIRTKAGTFLDFGKFALYWFPACHYFKNYIAKKYNYLTMKYKIHPEFTFEFV